MIDWNSCNTIARSPDRLGGAWVFRGTRVAVKALFENLEGGASLDDFVEWFPGVVRGQVLAILAHAAKSLMVA